MSAMEQPPESEIKRLLDEAWERSSNKHRFDPKALTQSLLTESDRGIGVLGGEIASEALSALLREYCRQETDAVKRFVDPLFTGYGPLATFSARINVAFALGIIKERDRIELDLIRKIRNDFAHASGPIDFGNPAIVQRLTALAGASGSDADAEQERRLIGGIMATHRQLVDRLAFALAIAQLIGRLQVARFLISAGIDIRRMNVSAYSCPLMEDFTNDPAGGK